MVDTFCMGYKNSLMFCVCFIFKWCSVYRGRNEKWQMSWLLKFSSVYVLFSNGALYIEVEIRNGRCVVWVIRIH